MQTPVENLVEQKETVEELDLVELGDVSQETKGNPLGGKGDAGLGWRF